MVEVRDYEAAASQLVQTKWTDEQSPCCPIWSEHHQNWVVTALGFDKISPSVLVLCEKTDSGWKAFEMVRRSANPHCLSFSTSPFRAYIWDCVLGLPDTVTIVFNSIKVVAPVVNGEVHFVDWSSIGTACDTDKWQPGQFCVQIDDKLVWDAALQPTWLQGTLATVKDFTDAYFLHATANDSDKDKYCWAQDLLSDLRFGGSPGQYDRDSVWDCVKTLIESAELGRDNAALQGLGAGPMEELDPEWLLDHIEHQATSGPEIYRKYPTALSGARMDIHKSSTITQRTNRFSRK